MLKRGAEVLITKMEKHGSVEVEYERPGCGKVQKLDDDGNPVFDDDDKPIYRVVAVAGQSTHGQEPDVGIIDRVARADFTIRRSRLVINGERITPRRNDIIRLWSDDGTLYEGRVLGDDGIPHFEPADDYGIAVRIHTKRDEVVTGNA